VVTAGLQQSMATREPYLEPRRETMCLRMCEATSSRWWPPALVRIYWTR
jgi:hypothetical protein